MQDLITSCDHVLCKEPSSRKIVKCKFPSFAIGVHPWVAYLRVGILGGDKKRLYSQATVVYTAWQIRKKGCNTII